MKTLECAHCGKKIGNDDQACPHCGLPLAPHKRKSPQRKFIWWFITIVIFCLLMIYFLPFFGATRHLGR